MSALLRIAAASAASTSGGLFSSLLASQTRAFVAPAGALYAKAKTKGAPAAAKKEEPKGMSATHATGLNFKKSGSDPEFGPDESYPDWLWALLEPRKTIRQLENEVAAAKAMHEQSLEDGKGPRYDIMDVKDIQRLLKLRRRAKIKENNDSRRRK
jgi:large subunit ribosomal protein L54